MRRASAINAFECNYIDVALATSAKGPRIVLKPKIRSSAISSPTLSIDLQCAKALSIALRELIAEADQSGTLN